MNRETVVELFGDMMSDAEWRFRVATIIRAAALDAVSDCDDFARKECDALAKQVADCIIAGVDLPRPKDGWESWFRDAKPLYAYERARAFGIVTD